MSKVDNRATGPIPSKRVKPFELKEVDIDKIIATDTGNLKMSPSVLSQDVSKAIAQLSIEEQEIIQDIFFSGRSLNDIAATHDIELNTVKVVRQKALDHIKFILENHYTSDKAVLYPNCPICKHPKSNEIDLFLHLWIDMYDGKLQGITRQIIELWRLDLRYKFNVIEEHLDLHVNIGKVGRRKSKQQFGTKKQRVNITIPLPTKLVEAIDIVCQQHQIPRSYLYCDLLTFALPVYQGMLNSKHVLSLLASKFGQKIMAAYLREEHAEII